MDAIIQRARRRGDSSLRRPRAAGRPRATVRFVPARAAKGSALPVTWLGVTDMSAALDALLAQYAVSAERAAHVGDGREDVLGSNGSECAVRHRRRTSQGGAAARYVTTAVGGRYAMEEIIDRIFGGARLGRVKKGGKFVAIGLMSGTSCDGVDAIAIDLRSVTKPHEPRIVAHVHRPGAALRRELLRAATLTTPELAALHFRLADD